MVSVPTVIGFLVIVVIHTVIAAVATRFFRLRLSTRWGFTIYTILFVPVIYLVTTLILSGFVGFGGEGVADTGTALVIAWVLPFCLGYSIDLFWMPPPEALPERAR